MRAPLLLLLFAVVARADLEIFSFDAFNRIGISASTPNSRTVNTQTFNVGFQDYMFFSFNVSTNYTCIDSMWLTLSFNSLGNSMLSSTQFSVGSFVTDFNATTISWNTFNGFNSSATIVNNQYTFAIPNQCAGGLNACIFTIGFFSNATTTNKFYGTPTTITIQGQTCNAINCSALQQPHSHLAPAYGDSWNQATCEIGYGSLPPSCYCMINGTWNCFGMDCNQTFFGCPAVTQNGSMFDYYAHMGYAFTTNCAPNYQGYSWMECLVDNTWNISSFNTNCTRVPTQPPPAVVFAPICSSLAFDFINTTTNIWIDLYMNSVAFTSCIACNIKNYTLTQAVYGQNVTVSACIRGTMPLLCSNATVLYELQAPTGFEVASIHQTNVSLTWTKYACVSYYSLTCIPLGSATTTRIVFVPPYQVTGISLVAATTCTLCPFNTQQQCASITFGNIIDTIAPTDVVIIPTINTTTITPQTDVVGEAVGYTVMSIIVCMIIAIFSVSVFIKRRRLKQIHVSNFELMQPIGNGLQYPLRLEENPTVLNTSLELFHLPGYMLIEDFANEVRLDQQFADGGESTIYECTLLSDVLRKRTNDAVIFKQYKKQMNLADEFFTEIIILNACLHSEHIVRILAYSCESPTCGILFPKYTTDLTSAIHAHKHFEQNPQHIVYAVLQLISALEYLHSIGVAHCDVKPSNIMFHHEVSRRFVSNNRGTLRGALDNNIPFKLKLGDFGTAYCELVECTRTQYSCAFTPKYSAPERFDTKFRYSIHAMQMLDVYAFGVTVAEMITQQQPYSGIQVDIKTPPPPTNLLPINNLEEAMFNFTPSEDAILLKNFINTSWSTDVNQRPTFQDLQRQIRAITK